MTFKLWHKLVLTIVCITGIVLSLASYLSIQSVKSGFLSYLNVVEARRSDSFSDILLNEYEAHQNWDFIKNNRRLWNRYFNQSKAINIRKESNQPALPNLNELGLTADKDSSQGTSEFPPKFSPPPPLLDHPEGAKRQPPPFMGKGNTGNQNFPLRGRKPPRKSVSLPPPNSLALLDANKTILVGGKVATEEAIFKPLTLNDKVVGYIRSEPFNQITNELDQQFVQHQTQAFFKIALFSLGIVLIGAGLLAAYLRSRINKIGGHAALLTSGDYSRQSLDKSQDELGQLSKKLNKLGDTLENNRSSRRRWISDISHELRTPVTVLKGEIEAIQDNVRELTPASIDSLHHEVLRLSRLIEDLNELSLSDLGALSYHKESLDIVTLVEDVIFQHQHQFDENKIDVSLNAANKNILIDGDGQRLEQLFANLANNSQHYTSSPGRIEIIITKRSNKVLVEWSDSEPGVSDEELEKLFERLYRVETSRNRNAGGSGLGLSICKNIVEAHEGTIVAKHSPLGGITFMITFENTNI